MAEQKEKLKMIKMKGYIGYVRSFNKLLKEYDKITWGKGRVPPLIVKKTPFKTTYKF